MSGGGTSAADAVFGPRDARLVPPNPLLVEHYPPNVVVSRRGVPGTFVGVGRGGKSRKLAGGVYVDLDGRRHVAGLALRASRDEWDFVDAPAGLIAPRAEHPRASLDGQAPPTPPVDLALLSSWSVPRCVVERYAVVAGIHRLHDWQVDLLRADYCSVMRGCNAVYSAPTSGGKTLVAELAMLRCVLRRRKKAMLVVPYRALCVEKARHLDAMFGAATLQLRVGSFFSSSGGTSMHAVDIGVCTIERGASLLNQLVSAGKLDTLGCIVVDEGHMLSEGSRGAVLECMLAKVKALAKHVPVEVDEAAVAAAPPVEFPTASAAGPAGAGIAGGGGSNAYAAPIPIDVEVEGEGEGEHVDEHEVEVAQDAAGGPSAGARSRVDVADVDVAMLHSAIDDGDAPRAGATASAAAGSAAAATASSSRDWVSLRPLLPAPSAPWVQIIVMSATLSNLPLLASWLDASYHASGTRPVQLTEHLCIDNIMYDRRLRPVCMYKPLPAVLAAAGSTAGGGRAHSVGPGTAGARPLAPRGASDGRDRLHADASASASSSGRGSPAIAGAGAAGSLSTVGRPLPPLATAGGAQGLVSRSGKLLQPLLHRWPLASVFPDDYQSALAGVGAAVAALRGDGTSTATASASRGAPSTLAVGAAMQHGGTGVVYTSGCRDLPPSDVLPPLRHAAAPVTFAASTARAPATAAAVQLPTPPAVPPQQLQEMLLKLPSTEHIDTCVRQPTRHSRCATQQAHQLVSCC